MRTIQPAVTVVVVNYNRRDLLRNCLQSLMRKQTVAIEIIVVDNGSDDGSVTMLEQEFLSNAYCDVRLIANQDNRGFCEANNQGFAVARGEFLALLNNDAEAEPGWVEALVAVFADPQVGMAASKVLVYDDTSRIDKVGHLIYLDGQNRGRGSGEKDQGQYDRMEEVLWPDGCAAMYRRSMIERIGGFDEDFFAYADDAELGLRARIAGWRCMYTPQAVVRHHRGTTLGLRSTRRVELIERNRVLLVAKLFPWSLLWLNGVFYAIRVGAGLWAAVRGKGEISRYPGWRNKIRVAMALLKGDWEALLMLPRILRKRGGVNRIRKLSPTEVWQLLLKYRISLKELSQQAI